MLLELDRPTHIPHSLIPFAVLPPYAPPGDYDRSTLLFVPDCYREATETFNRLQAAGLHLNEAGISVPTHPIDVAETVASLSLSLESNMVTTIPHQLLRLIPAKDGGKYFPAICTRTLLGAGVDHSRNRLGSIIDEFGYPVPISFRDESPYCIFPDRPEEGFKRQSKIIRRDIQKRLGDRYAKMDEQEIAILAGIGRATPEVVEKANLHISKKVADIHKSARVMNLAQLAMALNYWVHNNPAKPLFLVSTARLTNDQGTPPQAYLLNKIFDELGLDHTWIGMADVRSAALRTHPTGAVVVEVQPGEYEAIFTKIRDRFNAAVDKMIQDNPDCF